ncbi:hypothetical protein MZM54_33100 [[Brevibacterium] frigoritolerans]|nr:hypothetical protein [Peribacillus frigoritolerans]
MTDRKLCVYCGKWYSLELMTALHELDKDGELRHVDWYCESCRPAVKSNLAKLPYSDLFKWGEKGQDK